MTEARLRAHATFLASDELEGRNTGYPGAEKAAKYIVEKINTNGIVPMGDRAESSRLFTQKFKADGLWTENVLAAIPGSDPALREQVIVIGAHYDHLGTRRQSHSHRSRKVTSEDTIWNGADDNASGTSVVLEVALALAEGGIRCKRTLLFTFFSGEELGLLGSQWYVDHPVVPVASHRLLLNLDMVGRNPDLALILQGANLDKHRLRGLLAEAARKAALKISTYDLRSVPDVSDHFPFHERGVPFVFLFSGDHSDYHRPSDHVDRLAFGKMAKVARFTALTALAACDR